MQTSYRSLSCTLLLAAAAAAQTGTGLRMDNEAARKSSLQPRVEVPHDPALAPRSGLTIEAWITYDDATMPVNAGARYPSILRKGIGSFGNPANLTYLLRVDAVTSSARVLHFAIRTWDSLRNMAVINSAQYTFAAGEFKSWTHVAGTFDGKDLRLFVNGVEKAKVASSGPELYDEAKDRLSIGTGGLRDQYETWHGEIDEVRLWPFARTSAEIQSTMNLQLFGVPGLVSTWNLDGLVPTTTMSPDSSGGKNGTGIALTTASSGGQFASNTLAFAPGTLGASDFGTGTAGCAGTPAAAISGRAKVGSSALALVCVNANSGGPGFLWLGVARLTSPVPLLGAGVWVDTAQPGILVPVTGDGSGVVRLPITIPANTPANVSVHGQYVFSQTGCSVPLFASQGLTVTTE